MGRSEAETHHSPVHLQVCNRLRNISLSLKKSTPKIIMDLTKFIIGLDWDGTISHYSEAFAFLASRFDSVIIITVNDEITTEIAATTLKFAENRITVEICPDERIEDYHQWKAEICVKYGVNLMFDDDPKVVLACKKRGIHAITVCEFIYRFKED